MRQSLSPRIKCAKLSGSASVRAQTLVPSDNRSVRFLHVYICGDWRLHWYRCLPTRCGGHASRHDLIHLYAATLFHRRKSLVAVAAVMVYVWEPVKDAGQAGEANAETSDSDADQSI
jgi:hypothetical protein